MLPCMYYQTENGTTEETPPIRKKGGLGEERKEETGSRKDRESDGKWRQTEGGGTRLNGRDP